MDSCLRGGGWAFAGVLEELESMDSCLRKAVGHRNDFLKKWNPLKIINWVQLHLYK